jgi:glycosyltransferase involved in cell wall biosynthesis
VNIVQITPGAGGMYCGNCFRDNALVTELRKLGHQTLMVPLYLPMTLDEDDQSRGVPTFFGGVNVYLEQKSPLFRHSPMWLHRWLASPGVLQWAAGRAAKTRAADVGDITISMLRGEEGNQVRELDELIDWMKQQPHPDIICLSNALLVGMARKLKQELRSKIVCMLQGEDYFLDSLPVADREPAWKTLSDRARSVDLFIAPSRYFGELMARRINLPVGRVKFIYNGIQLDGYEEARNVSTPEDGTRNLHPPTLGYFARMCREKGLDTLVEAYILLRQRGRIGNLQLHVGGGCGPADEPFVASLKARLEANGFLAEAEFHPNLSRAAKQAFYRRLTVFSVPALYGEAFGLYVIEALASGIPVVLPRVASFPELIEATGGGILCEPRDPKALADAIEQLLLEPARIRTLGETGRRAVRTQFSAESMTRQIAELYELLSQRPDRETKAAVGAV